LDKAGNVAREREADFADDSGAVQWMRAAGAEQAAQPGWNLVELRCQGRFIAGLPAWAAKTSWKSK